MAKKKIRTSSGATNTSVSSEELNRRIAEAAYFRALQRGFQGGDPLQDWLEAEQDVARAAPAQASQR